MRTAHLLTVSRLPRLLGGCLNNPAPGYRPHWMQTPQRQTPQIQTPLDADPPEADPPDADPTGCRPPWRQTPGGRPTCEQV